MKMNLTTVVSVTHIYRERERGGERENEGRERERGERERTKGRQRERKSDTNEREMKRR